MPPKKQRNQTVTPIPRLRTRKHKCELTINTESARKKQKVSNKSNDEIDTFCWICHKSGQSRQFKKCGKCPRVYHHKCITKPEEFSNKCPECQAESVDETELSEHLSSKSFLKKLLQLCVSRVFVKKRENLFNSWPESLGKNKLVKIIDSEILRDNINRPLYYKKTARFFSDVKFMYHNCVILFKDKSRLTNAAKLVEDFKQELLDIEACPQCYYNMHHQDSVLSNSFVSLCEPPHEIIWAYLKGWSYWPAKCLKVVNNENGSRIARVRFFGKHEKSSIPLEDCYFISKSHPKYPNSNPGMFSSGPKRPHYRDSINELIEYIDLYIQKYGNFTFSEHQTPFRPINARSLKDIQTKVVEATIAGNSSFALKNGAPMKLEANKIESVNTGGGIIPQSSVMEFSENCERNVNECDHRNTIDSTNKCNEVSRSIPDDIGKQLSGNVSVIMTFEQEASPSTTGNNIDTVSPTPVVLSVGSLSENYSFVHSPSAMSPGSELTLDLNSITSGDDCARILNPITEDADAIKLIESHSPKNKLNVSVDLQQNSKSGDNPQESGSGQVNVGSPQATDTSNIGNIVSEDNAGIEIVLSEDDDDVVIIEPPTIKSAPVIPEQQTKYFNPSLVLQHILQNEAELKRMFEIGKHVTEAMLVRLWANSSRIPSAPERITAALEKWQRARDENITLLHEKNTIAEKLKNTIKENKKNLIEIKSLKSQLEGEQQKCFELEYRAKQMQCNAKLIIASFKEKVEQSSKATYSEKKSSTLLECKEKTLEQAQKEFDDLKMEKQRVEDALKQIQQEHSACADIKYDPEKILMFKLLDHCRVCYSRASIHCCQDHNYCCKSHKNADYEAHHKTCKKIQNRESKLEPGFTAMHCIPGKIAESKISLLLEKKNNTSLVPETFVADTSCSEISVKEMAVFQQKTSSLRHHSTSLPTPLSLSD